MARSPTKGGLSDEEIRSIVGAEIRSSLGFLGSDLSAQRAEMLKRYLGEPYGDERPDRSQVVSSDIADTVEWILPSLLKVFAAGDDVVQFSPQGPEDEEVAKQATEYANWIFLRDNPGFLILYTWFKDALLSKNGIVKTWWDVSERKKKERYEGLTDDAFALLMADVEAGEVEIIAHTEYEQPVLSHQPIPIHQPQVGADPGIQAPGAGPAQPQIPMLHDVVVQKTKQYGCARVMGVPPEEFLISKEARTVQDARFIGHRVRKTISELIAEGYDKNMIESLGIGGKSIPITEEETARITIEDESRPSDVTTGTVNPQMREVWVVEAYMKCDRDGDGIAEQLKVTVAGTGWELLEWGKDAPEGKSGLDIEEWDGPVPFASLTPIIMPHRFFGRSIAETIADLSRVKTLLTRQLLDALYLANNPRHQVFEDAIVDPSELLSAKPGGFVRINTPTPAIMPLVTEDVSQQAIAALQYADGLLESRTGVTKYTQGLDANTLNKTATGVNQIMTAAQQRVDLIARVFAETGVKDLFKLILALVTQHQNEPRIIRLREQWVPMDPREWDSEMDVTINVGLGTGNKDQQAATLFKLLETQQQIGMGQGGMNGPILTWANVYKTLDRIIPASGIAKNAEGFFTDPANSPPPPPPPPDPKLQAIELQAKMDSQQQQQDMQIQMQKAQLERQDQQHEQAIREQEMRMQAAFQFQKEQQEMALERARFDMQMRHDAASAELKRQILEISAHQKMQHADMAATQKAEQAKSKPKGP